MRWDPCARRAFARRQVKRSEMDEKVVEFDVPLFAEDPGRMLKP
jgi:hypothetical protein